MPLISAAPICAGEEGIFAEGVVAAAEFEVAIDVDEGLQGDIDAQRAVFAADDEAVVFGVFDAEGGGDAHGGGFALRGMAGEHAGRSVGKAQAGNAEPRNAGEISGLALIDGWVFVGAVDQGQLLFERHLAQQLVDARIAGDDGNGLRECASGGDSKEC